jgi:hypothetical protein
MLWQGRMWKIGAHIAHVAVYEACPAEPAAAAAAAAAGSLWAQQQQQRLFGAAPLEELPFDLLADFR